MPSGYVLPYSVLSRSRPHPPRRPHRPSLALRARVWLRAVDLDAALAGGNDPTRTPELTLRAQQLARPGKRSELATAVEHLVAITDRGNRAAIATPLAPFRPWQVKANRSLLLELAGRLRGKGPHALQGLAMTALMLEDGTGPLNFDDRSVTLERALRACLATLEF